MRAPNFTSVYHTFEQSASRNGGDLGFFNVENASSALQIRPYTSGCRCSRALQLTCKKLAARAKLHGI